MTQDRLPPLEERIRRVLWERARIYEPSPIHVMPQSRRQAPLRPPRRWRPMVLGATVVAAVTVLVVAWVVVARPASDTSMTSTPDATLVSPIGTGDEIPLSKVETPQRIESSLQGAQLVPGSSPVTLQPGKGPSVTVTNQLSLPDNAPRNCLTIERQTTAAVSGTSSQCLSSGLLQVFHYPQPETSTDASVYYAWLEVPGDAAYVSFESSLLMAWQRPVDGIVVIPVEDGPVQAIARAFASEGQPLAEIEIPLSYNGAQYLPGETPTTEPQPYTEPAGLTLAERCEVLPLSALGLGDGPTQLVHDQATGMAIEFDKREYCRQSAALSPDPAGDIVASFYVRNGAVAADYFERVDTEIDGGVVSSQGAPIPFDEAQRRIAAQRAERDY